MARMPGPLTFTPCFSPSRAALPSMPKTFCLFAMLASTVSAVAADIDFARDIRPILSDNCFACHGPDANKRKAELRLDLKDSAFGKAESGASGDCAGRSGEERTASGGSARRIQDDVMPPPKEHKALKPEQVELLKRWMKEGANWTGHWAFEPVKPVAVPEVAAANESDRCIRRRRVSAKEGLEACAGGGSGTAAAPRLAGSHRPAAVAWRRWMPLSRHRRRTAIRRLRAGRSIDCSRRRILANGSRCRGSTSRATATRAAITTIRCATCGSGASGSSRRSTRTCRSISSPSSKSRAIFCRMRPSTRRSRRGFHRNVMTSDEGGLIEQEYLNLYVVDRVATTGVTWLGLTVGVRAVSRPQIRPDHAARFLPGCTPSSTTCRRAGRTACAIAIRSRFCRCPRAEQTAEQTRLDGGNRRRRQAGAGTRPRRSMRSRPSGKRRSSRAAQAVEPNGPWVKIPLDADGNGASDDGQKNRRRGRRARARSWKARWANSFRVVKQRAGSSTATSSGSKRISRSPSRRGCA